MNLACDTREKAIGKVNHVGSLWEFILLCCIGFPEFFFGDFDRRTVYFPGKYAIDEHSILNLLAIERLEGFDRQAFGVQLSLSVFSRADYLFTREAVTATGTVPSDVSQIAEALILPYWFWGACCGALSVAVLLVALVIYLRGPQRLQP